MPREREDTEPWSLLAEGELWFVWYGKGSARSKLRRHGFPLYVMSGWIWVINAGRGVVVNSDCGVGGAVDDDAVESENVGDGVRELGYCNGSTRVCTAFVTGSTTRTRFFVVIDSERKVR